MIKGSSSEPFVRISPYDVHIGELWLMDNFLLAYVKFLTYLMGHTSKWNNQGYLICGEYVEQGLVGESYINSRFL